jgi:cytochrome c
LKRAGAVIVLSVVAVVGMARIHPFGNPRVEPARGLDTLLQGANMPTDARKLLVAKCAACHSNETRWPVYSRLAPGSWLIERDIVEARKKMNLSAWEQMSGDAGCVDCEDYPRSTEWGYASSAIPSAALGSEADRSGCRSAFVDE